MWFKTVQRLRQNISHPFIWRWVSLGSRSPFASGEQRSNLWGRHRNIGCISFMISHREILALLPFSLVSTQDESLIWPEVKHLTHLPGRPVLAQVWSKVILTSGSKRLTQGLGPNPLSLHWPQHSNIHTLIYFLKRLCKWERYLVQKRKIMISCVCGSVNV